MATEAHNADLCSCQENGPCVCPCPKCMAFAKRRAFLEEQDALMRRLEKAGIAPEALAMLMWRYIGPLIEAKIERIAKDEVERIVKQLRIGWATNGEVRRP